MIIELELIMAGVGLTTANYSYELMTRQHRWGEANKSTYFQLSALIVFYIIHTLMRIL